MLAGRRALKEIKWTGEQGRQTARRAVAVNAVITGALVTGLIAVSVTDGPQGINNVLQLKARQCFNPTGEKVLNPNTGVGTLDRVKIVDCSAVHRGEVVGRWDVRTAWVLYPDHDELTRQAETECSRLLDGYAMDSWRLPRSTGVGYYAPTRQGWESQGVHDIVCYAESGPHGSAGSIRQPRRVDLGPDRLPDRGERVLRGAVGGARCRGRHRGLPGLDGVRRRHGRGRTPRVAHPERAEVADRVCRAARGSGGEAARGASAAAGCRGGR